MSHISGAHQSHVASGCNTGQYENILNITGIIPRPQFAHSGDHLEGVPSYGLFSPSLLHSTQPPSCHLESANLCLTRLSPGRKGGGGDWSELAASRTKLVLPSPSAGPKFCPSLCPGCQAEAAELGQVLPPAQQTQAFDRGVCLYTEKCDLKLTGEQSLRHELFQAEVCTGFERTCAAGACLCTESGHLRQVQPRQSDSRGKKSTVGNTYP